MAAILRIAPAPVPASRFGAAPDPAKDYLDRLIKLIPGEVVGLYLVGRGILEGRYPVSAGAGGGLWLAWTLFGLLACIAVRAWATSSKSEGTPVEWPAVIIAALSFLLWVYALGDVYRFVHGLWDPTIASLLVLAWTFAVPLIYRPAGGSGSFSARAPGGVLAGREAVSPGDFSQPQAEARVLEGVARVPAHEPALTDTVSDVFDDADKVRILMSKIQDVIGELDHIRVSLADGSDAEMDALGARTYLSLARWVRDEVIAHGQML